MKTQHSQKLKNKKKIYMAAKKINYITQSKRWAGFSTFKNKTKQQLHENKQAQ